MPLEPTTPTPKRSRMLSVFSTPPPDLRPNRAAPRKCEEKRNPREMGADRASLPVVIGLQGGERERESESERERENIRKRKDKGKKRQARAFFSFQGHNAYCPWGWRICAGFGVNSVLNDPLSTPPASLLFPLYTTPTPPTPLSPLIFRQWISVFRQYSLSITLYRHEIRFFFQILLRFFFNTPTNFATIPSLSPRNPISSLSFFRVIASTVIWLYAFRTRQLIMIS